MMSCVIFNSAAPGAAGPTRRGATAQEEKRSPAGTTARNPNVRSFTVIIPGRALSDLGARSAARVGERFRSQRSNISISVHEHARGRGLRADEGEFAGVSTVRKEAFAPAQQDRADEQQNLVDQSLLEQHGCQRRTSPDDQVRAVL